MKGLELMSNLKKRQHYVPRFYLRNFAEGEKINYIDKQLNKPLEKLHIDKVAQQMYYYDFPEEFVESEKKAGNQTIERQYLENYLSVLEDAISNSLRNVNDKILSTEDILSAKLNDLINETDKKQLATFIAIQSIRTPSYRILGAKFFEFMKTIMPSEFNSLFSNDLDENIAFYYHLKSGVLDRLIPHFIENLDYENNSIRSILPNGTMETIAHDPRILWPDTFSIGPDEYLYVIVNQLHRQARFNYGKDLRQKPYSLLRMKIGEFPAPTN